MKKIARIALAVLLSSQATLNAQELKTGPRSKSVTATDLIAKLNDKIAKEPGIKSLTDEQIGMMSRITFYKDRQYPNVYYYTPPFTVAKGGPNLYTEDFNIVAFQAIRSLTSQVLGELNENDPLSGAIKKGVFAVDIGALASKGEAEDRVGNDNAKLTAESIGAVTKILISERKLSEDAFVRSVKLAAATIGWPNAQGISDFSTALNIYSHIVTESPVLTITIPVAFGLNKASLEAFAVLRKGLPEITFYELEMDPIWHLRALPYVSDRPQQDQDTASDVWEANLRIDNGLAVNRANVPISSSGGNMLLPLTYAGSIRFGYGFQNDLGELANDSIESLNYLLPGYLIQEQEIYATFNGTARCVFKGGISLSRQVELEKAGGKVVPVNSENSSANFVSDTPDINECKVYDANLNELSYSDPEIQKIVEAFKARHISENLKIFNASVTTKEAILAKALADEAAWASLPMPQVLKKATTQKKFQECAVSQRKGACLDHSAGGWGRKRKCVKWEIVPFDDCQDVYKWIDEYVLEDAKMAYFSSDVSFEEIFNETKVFKISLSSEAPIKFALQSFNNACIARSKFRDANNRVFFERSPCTAVQSNGAVLDKTIDKEANDQTPILGGVGKSPL